MSLSLSRRQLCSAVIASILPGSAQSGEATKSPIILKASHDAVQIKGSIKTDVFSFNNLFPGPLLRFSQGDQMDIKLVNELDLPLTLHWHGMRGDNAMDGVAPLTQNGVTNNQDFSYRRQLSEPGLFCYRPSVYGHTPELMGRGLKGLLIVDEPEPLPCDLDLAILLDSLIIDLDHKFTGDFDPQISLNSNRIQDALLTVNGKIAPLLQGVPPGGRVRLRLANLSNAQIMIVRFTGIKPFVIAIDSQPCTAFEPVRSSIPMAPGARFELMFEMPTAPTSLAKVALFNSEKGDQEVIVFNSQGSPISHNKPVASLPLNKTLPAEIKLGSSKKVDLTLSLNKDLGKPSWTINGKRTEGYSGAPLFKVKVGSPVTLGYINQAPIPVAMHVHGHAVRLLHDKDDGWEPYWRNGVIVPPLKTKHVAFVADAPGKWALHDDILENEAAGLATWFLVE
jgi:FtsP/CotA-like multicopper oxidase with cupredoxin domain